MGAVVHRHGPPAGPDQIPLVLLHAFPFDSRIWAAVVHAMPDTPVLTVDLPGFGAAAGSVEPEGAILESFADSVARAVREEQLERAVVAGLSMGGYVAMALAERHPDLLAGIALLGTKASEDAPEARAARLQMARRALETGDAAPVIEMVDSLLSQDAPQSRPAVVQQVRDWLREAPPQGVAAAQRAMASRPDRLFVLQTLQVPALVLYGSEDAITGSADHEVMARALGTEAVRIDGAGHLSAVEAPKEVAQALEELYHRAGGPG